MVLHRKVFLNCRVCLACGKRFGVLQKDFLDEVVSFQKLVRQHSFVGFELTNVLDPICARV